VKRKRGKLNLEKAMNKNIFQEAKLEQINKFETMKISSECKVRFTAPGEHKKSIKSNKSNHSRDDKHASSALNKDKNEISPNSSTKSEKSTNKRFNTPAMYRIAMSLKKYTENKFKKVHQESSTNLLNKDDSDSLKAPNESLKIITEENNVKKINSDVDVEKHNLLEPSIVNADKNENSKTSAEIDEEVDEENEIKKSSKHSLIFLSS
jgi:hypothetical protein